MGIVSYCALQNSKLVHASAGLIRFIRLTNIDLSSGQHDALIIREIAGEFRPSRKDSVIARISVVRKQVKKRLEQSEVFVERRSRNVFLRGSAALLAFARISCSDDLQFLHDQSTCAAMSRVQISQLWQNQISVCSRYSMGGAAKQRAQRSFHTTRARKSLLSLLEERGYVNQIAGYRSVRLRPITISGS